MYCCVALNSCSSCFSLLSVGITDVYNHSWTYSYFSWKALF
jgi:hypothetical protein